MNAKQAIKASKEGFVISASCYSDGSYAIEQEKDEPIEEFIKRAKESMKLQLQYFEILPNGERIWHEGEPEYYAR